MASFIDNVCFTDEAKSDILARLKRAEGQLRGIQKMIEEERSCQDMVIQLVAVKSAIAQIAMAALSNQLIHCLASEMKEGKPVEKINEKFIEIFKKLA
jgi:CsoR family transcriptional regulator, copper-sensing transcriptional repressor